MIDVDELANMFRSEAHDRLEELKAALQGQPELCDAGKLDDARRAAHNLKGAALTVGAQPIAGLCRILESEVQAQVAAGGPPNTEQLGTWRYIVSEMEGIVDVPDIIQIQLTGFSDLPSPSDTESHLERTSGTLMATAPSSLEVLTVQELVAKLAQVAQLQSSLLARTVSLQQQFDERAAIHEADAAPHHAVGTQAGSDLALLREQLLELGLIVGQFARPLK